MSADIARESIAEQLGDVKYDRFLFYLMGPYKSFNLNYVLSEEERDGIDIEELPGPLRKCKEKAPCFSAGMNPTLPFTNHRR